MLKKALLIATISSMVALGANAFAKDVEVCGKRASAGIFLVDYSGSMMKNATVNNQEIQKISLVKDFLEKLPQIVSKESDVLVGVGTVAPHTLLVAPQLVKEDRFVMEVEELPDSLEVFGRNTNIGEGLAGFDKRIQSSEREQDQKLKELFTNGAGVILAMDGGLNNRGREVVSALLAFKEKYRGTKLTVLSLAQTEEERDNLKSLEEAVNAPVYELQKVLADKEYFQSFVESTLYKPCGTSFFLSADVLFDFDKAQLKPKGIKEIERVSKEILRYKSALAESKVKLSISAHTDRIGSESYNDRLSQRRLNTVLQEFSKNEVEPQFFVEKIAFGKRQPITGDACNGMQGEALRKCLQPDRRLEVRMMP